MSKRNLTPLILGFLLIAMGSILLAANYLSFDIAWLRWLQYIFPALLLAWGLIKLTRHFTWEKQRLLESPGRASLLSGIFWTSVGGLWILHLAGVLGFFDSFGTFWPLSLILFGMGKIIDYYRLEGQLQFRISEVIGLLFVILFGVVCGFAADAHFPLLNLPISLGDSGSIRVGEFIGTKYTWDESESVPAEDLTQIQVVNRYGDVTVESGPSDSIELDLLKEVFGSSEDEAKVIADKVSATTSVEGKMLRIGTNRPDVTSDKKTRFKTHLSLKIPAHFSVRINNGYGDVKIKELEGTCEVENEYGDVVVQDSGNDVKIRNRFKRAAVLGAQGTVHIENQRGAVEAQDIEGDVVLKTDYNSISARHITGNAQLKNRFGRVTVDGVSGTVGVEAPGSKVVISDVQQEVVAQNSHKDLIVSAMGSTVDLETSYGKVQAAQISGLLNIKAKHTEINASELESGIVIQAKGSKVVLTDVDGPFNVTTSLRDVSVINFSGAGEIQNEFGQVHLSCERLEDSLSVANKRGPIRIQLPGDAAFKLRAQASPGGKVISEFGDGQEEGLPVLDATVGSGGPEVRLQTSHGEIRIQKQ
jgi:hypothetical protein